MVMVGRSWGRSRTVLFVMAKTGRRPYHLRNEKGRPARTLYGGKTRLYLARALLPPEIILFSTIIICHST